MIQYGETIHSALPQDIPWFLPDYAIFFGVFYLVLTVILGGFGSVIVRSFLDSLKVDNNCK